MPKNKPLIVIVGETATGKTQLSLNLARLFNGEIICCDSRTIYKDMIIGTASPSQDERRIVKHHLLNVIDPLHPISAAEFKQLCTQAIKKIQDNSKIPFLVGGSGLYIDSVIYNYSFNDDEKGRQELKELSIEELKAIINKTKIPMPINNKNPRHLISAITNNGIFNDKKIIDNCLIIGIKADNELIKENIRQRINSMFEKGLEDEARSLSKKYGWESEPMKSIGYREFRQYFEGKSTINEVKTNLIKDTLSYAKRQRTWFKRNKNIHWIEKQSQAVELITTFLNK